MAARLYEGLEGGLRIEGLLDLCFEHSMHSADDATENLISGTRITL